MVLWWVSVICHNDLFYIFINVSHYKIVSLEQGSQTEIATISLSQSQYPIHTALTLPANGHAFHSDPNHVSAARRTLLPHVAPHDVGPAGVRVPRLCLQLVAVPARHELDAIDSVSKHFALSRVWTGIRLSGQKSVKRINSTRPTKSVCSLSCQYPLFASQSALLPVRQCLSRPSGIVLLVTILL